MLGVRAFESELGEAVLGDLHAGTGVPHLGPEGRHVGDGETGIVGHDDRPGVLEHLVQRRDELAFSALSTASLHLAANAGLGPPVADAAAPA